MHLNEPEIPVATQRLISLLVPGGTLYLSCRVSTRDASIRDDNGRLYASFEKGLVVQTLLQDPTIIFDQEDVSASSGKVEHRLIAKRND